MLILRHYALNVEFSFNSSDTAKVKIKVKGQMKLCTKTSNICRKRHPIVEILSLLLLRIFI